MSSDLTPYPFLRAGRPPTLGSIGRCVKAGTLQPLRLHASVWRAVENLKPILVRTALTASPKPCMGKAFKEYSFQRAVTAERR